MILLDVPRMVCLPSLITLHLRGVTYFSEDSLQRLLTNCPVLEDLLVHHRFGDMKMKKFAVIVPSLQRLSLDIPFDVDELVINTPSLKYFKLVHRNSKSHYCSIENMPELREAIVDVQFPDLKSLIRSIASVKRLEFCLTADISEGVFGDDFVFNKLEHLKLCSCAQNLSNVLVWLLKVSPNLQGLDLHRIYDHENEGLVSWTHPSTVPECMLSSLQTFGWSEYLGRLQDRDLVAYILENTRSLKTATISTDDDCLVPELEMLKELALCSRASASCKLVFDLNH
ncbi:hypothetical protein AALP_AA8G107400 [Arabis alpina]|uniref:FBD domain-containing protein n=1 Tax=Arabis alpina TaxID=50452 RepID=A0A087G685_ARAAL|nr:hypothetical protein AALP_AA8G107400 [Arabis alpina]